ncbi:MAG: toll/interleukin-1 receptor domain-containing protein [Xanthomonadales bacterium]|nr:toll/interleukin-1 receptor domain-containing protein [Xanthomonadales bacterium]
MAGFCYKAFISYSHTDEHWARWLQHALESYRVPKVLVGKRTGYGEIPARLGAVFRDREDLSSATSLTESVQHELSSAESLVVICSPAAAQSPWVKEEIKAYKALGRADRIYALIVDGDPQSSDPAEQCFPAALVTLDDGSTLEPLAADIRKWADGKGLAKLKLIAGILGIRLDELRRREMHRRRRKLTTVAVGVSAVVLLTTFLSVTAINNRKESDQRRANTEDLVSFMLGKLEDLSPVAGLDVLDEDQQEMVRVAEQWGFQELDDEVLLQKALEWREEGMTARYARDNEAAMTAFSRSLAALVNLYLRDKDNTNSLFELGQAEFWVGYTHLDNGDLEQAERMMTFYGVIARRLINADPKSAVNVMELSYTLTNLGAIETMRAGGDDDKRIYLAQAALEYNQLALVLEPDNQDNMITMAGSHAWLADAWLGVCSLYKANQSRLEGIAVVKQMLEQSPDDPELLIDLSHGLGGLSNVQSKLGQMDLAEENLSASATLLDDVAKQENDKNGYAWDRLVRLGSLGRMMVDTGRIEEGRNLISESTRLMAEQYDPAGNPSFEKNLDVAISLSHQVSLAIEMENINEARKLNLEAIRILSEIVSKSPDSAIGQYRLAHALIQYWQLNEKLPPPEWQKQVEDYSMSNRPVRSCDLAALAARQAVMRGDLVSAKSHNDYLFDKKYREPGYVRFCQAYGLCK